MFFPKTKDSNIKIIPIEKETHLPNLHCLVYFFGCVFVKVSKKVSVFVQPECMHESLPWMALAKTKPWNSFDQHHFFSDFRCRFGSTHFQKIFRTLKMMLQESSKIFGPFPSIYHVFWGFFWGHPQNLRKNISKVLPIGQLRASGSFQQLPSRSPFRWLGGFCRIGTKVGNVWMFEKY